MLKRAFVPALLVLFVSVNVMAQTDDPRPHGMRFRNLDLTEEQQAQIEEITTATMKEHLSVRSKLQTQLHFLGVTLDHRKLLPALSTSS